MPTEKRQRQDEGRLSRRIAEVEATKKQQRTRSVRTLAVILGGLLVAAALWSVLGGGDDDDPVVASGSSTSTTADPSVSTTTPAAVVEVTYPEPGESITGETPCPDADGSAARTTMFEKAPPMCIDTAKTYRATVETTEGTMVFELDDTAAPVTVNSFVVLARYHFYDGVPFHRIIPGFVDQAGTADAAQTSPGYTIAEELPDSTDSAAVYPEGTLAGAKQQAPGTTSSQFFITVGDGGSRLAVDYTPFGKVVEGIEVARTINQFGDEATNGTPTKDIKITKVTITES